MLTRTSLPSHTGALTWVGLEIGLLTQEGSQQRGAARSNHGWEAGPAEAAARGPKDELTAHPKSGLCPVGGNPCVGT